MTNPIRIPQNSGWWIISVLSFLPLALWFLAGSLAFKFSNSSLVFRSLGDIFGLCGMAMFSLVMIISAKLKFFEKFFKSSGELYLAHHVFGGLTLCLLLFHPLFLACNYLSISFRAAALFLLPGSNWALNFGIIGLFIMIIALVFTFYTKLKHQTWLFTHKFLELAFVFAFLHTFLIGGDLLLNLPLKIYLLVLGILAIIIYFGSKIWSKT